jgi:hypothetical protein
MERHILTTDDRAKARAGWLALGRLKVGERNKTEAAYEAFLEARRRAGEVAWYRFEGVKLRLADDTFYTPDFAVMFSGGSIEMHEVKGNRAIFYPDAKLKVKVASEMYPFRFVVAFPARKDTGVGWDFDFYG